MFYKIFLQFSNPSLLNKTFKCVFELYLLQENESKFTFQEQEKIQKDLLPGPWTILEDLRTFLWVLQLPVQSFSHTVIPRFLLGWIKMELEEPEHIWYTQHSVCSAFVKSVSFGGTAAISSCSVLEGWSNVGVVLAPGTEAAGCFWELLSPVHTASSHTVFEQPSSLLLPAYSDGWDELLYICSFFPNLFITSTWS